MLAPLIKKIFGSKNDRQLKRMGKVVKVINALEDELLQLADEQLQARTGEFKARLEKGESLDHIMPCLLYTSPSPRDRPRSRMPSSA